MKKLKPVGVDDWGRPFYKDEDGKLWKDINLGTGAPSLYRASSNSFDGEPDYPLEEEFEAVTKDPARPQIGDKYREICERLEWSVTEEDDGTVELEKYSPAGEDFIFTVDAEGFVDNVKEYAASFDIDDHIAMWIEAKQNGTAGVPSARELVKDAEDIDKMLQELAAALFAAECEEDA
ncbi:MAG: hypothetical protein BWY85_00285 [Firmicutes bacterium ADurb.Bin506]|nr:MAG: hypothetical protein BWY85_00285 [Firmicutes bacterium ADurb.Bin506]